MLLLLAALWNGCTLQESDLPGRWQAVAFYQNGRRVQTPLDVVALDLLPDGRYQFQSQGLYRENGTYHLSMFYLFLTDTTVQPAKEHTVKILYLSADSLKIRMQEAGKEQVLFFRRQK